ncbi:uncharacterized protein LOC135690282 isoform X1 [Rhopilema esculentum]|uniref:uncharacterized protein LOC135690282 isoform X1 n=1 Tax=Rhopilema esculentum TaxID=499914 RepID=UPI0031CFC3F2
MDFSLGRPPPHLEGEFKIQIYTKGAKKQGWKQRYIRVIQDTLSIFESEEKFKKDLASLLSIKLTEANILDTVADHAPRGFSVNWAVNIVSVDKTITFLAKNAEEHAHWLDGLQYVKRFWTDRASVVGSNNQAAMGENRNLIKSEFCALITDIHGDTREIRLAKAATYKDVYRAMHPKGGILGERAAYLWAVNKDGTDSMVRKLAPIHVFVEDGCQLFMIEKFYKVLVIFLDDGDFIATPALPSITVSEVAKLPRVVEKLQNLEKGKFVLVKKFLDSGLEIKLSDADKPLEIFYELENGIWRRKVDVKAKLIGRVKFDDDSDDEEVCDGAKDKERIMPIPNSNAPDLNPVYRTPSQSGESRIRSILQSRVSMKISLGSRKRDVTPSSEAGKPKEQQFEAPPDEQLNTGFVFNDVSSVSNNIDSLGNTTGKIPCAEGSPIFVENSQLNGEEPSRDRFSSHDDAPLQPHVISNEDGANQVEKAEFANKEMTQSIAVSSEKEHAILVPQNITSYEEIEREDSNESEGNPPKPLLEHVIRLSEKRPITENNIVCDQRQKSSSLGNTVDSLKIIDVLPEINLSATSKGGYSENEHLSVSKDDENDLFDKNDTVLKPIQSGDSAGHVDELKSCVNGDSMNFETETDVSQDKGLANDIDGNESDNQVAFAGDPEDDGELEKYLNEGEDFDSEGTRRLKDADSLVACQQSDSAESGGDSRNLEEGNEEKFKNLIQRGISEELQDYLDNDKDGGPNVLDLIAEASGPSELELIPVAGHPVGMILPTGDNPPLMTTLNASEEKDLDGDYDSDSSESVSSIEGFMDSVNGKFPDKEQEKDLQDGVTHRKESATEEEVPDASNSIPEAKDAATTLLSQGTKQDDNTTNKHDSAVENQQPDAEVFAISLQLQGRKQDDSTTDEHDPAAENSLPDTEEFDERRKRKYVLKEGGLMKDTYLARRQRLQKEREAKAKALEEEAAAKKAADDAKVAVTEENVTAQEPRFEQTLIENGTAENRGILIDKPVSEQENTDIGHNELRSASPQPTVDCSSCDLCERKPFQVVTYKQMELVLRNCTGVGQQNAESNYDYICLTGVHLVNAQGTWDLADDTDCHSESELTDSLDAMRNITNPNDDNMIAKKIVKGKKVDLNGGICCHWIPKSGCRLGKWRVTKFKEESLAMPRNDKDWNLRPIPSPCFGSNPAEAGTAQAHVKEEPLSKRVNEMTGTISRKVSKVTTKVNGILSNVLSPDDEDAYIPLEVIRIREQFIGPLHEVVNRVRSQFIDIPQHRYRKIGDDSINTALGWLVRREFYNAFSKLLLIGRKEDSTVARFILGRTTSYNMWSLAKDIALACAEEPVLFEIVNIIENSPFLFDDDLRARNFICEALNWQSEAKSEKLLVTWFRTFVRERGIISKFFTEKSLWRRHEKELEILVRDVINVLSLLNEYQFNLHADFEHKELTKRFENQSVDLILQRQSKDVDLDVMVFE